MGLEKILERIQASGQAQAAEILDDARHQAQVILENARAEAEQRRRDAYQETLAPAAGECAHIRNEANFIANCVPGLVRERFLETVFKQVQEQISCVRSAPVYPDALRKMLREVLPKDNGQHNLKTRIVLQANPRDKALLEDLLRECNLDAPVEYTLNCWGGLNACAPDGSWRMVNTIESRLERASPYLKQSLAAWIEREIHLPETEKFPEINA